MSAPDPDSECIEDMHLVPALVALPFALLLAAFTRLKFHSIHNGGNAA